MNPYEPYLAWIDSQLDSMRRLVMVWAGTNSAGGNQAGLLEMCGLLKKAFQVLNADIEEVALPSYASIDDRGNATEKALGRALVIKMRSEAHLRVFLSIHMDTVFGPEDSVGTPTQLGEKRLQGPGVADAKGGLAVVLKALEAFERSPFADRVGWELLINPDEEIGSPGSASILAEAAARHQFGLVFEPALPDGALVAARKGSGNFVATFHGKAAHAGREPHKGRSAINAMARFILDLNSIQEESPGITVNVGRVSGGGALNVVPDLAQCRFNIRIPTPEDQAGVLGRLEHLVAQVNRREGLSVELRGAFTRPAKPLDYRTEHLLNLISKCGNELGLSLDWRSSGGVCDGNNLSAAGLPTVDSMGVRGDHLHSPHEVLYLDSLTERAKLTALLLMKLGSGEIEAP
ncbi:MAG: hydrolase [Deltaproteobacteria bacterium]|nr:hydrolase [Deltaproteobacteria bacterium]